jgi:asparagine synthase (glutamine-hydrolysing)
MQEYLEGSVIAEELYRSRTLNDALINHFEYKLEHLLKWEDRNSMWFSLESRVPFLDHNLVERMLTLDAKAFIRRGMTKSILRESMRGILPEEVRMRTGDVGFDTPEGDWFRSTPLREKISDIIRSDSFSKRGLIDAGRAQILFNKHLRGKLNLSKDIWKWINLELWFRRFVDH